MDSFVTLPFAYAKSLNILHNLILTVLYYSSFLLDIDILCASSKQFLLSIKLFKLYYISPIYVNVINIKLSSSCLNDNSCALLP